MPARRRFAPLPCPDVLRVAIACALPLACTAPADIPPSAAGPTIPDHLIGSFVDDYGSTYWISDTVWVHGSDTLRIDAWNADARHLVATASGADGATTWVRIDWVELPGSGEAAARDGAPESWPWAWCMAAYDASSRTDALEAPASRRDTPRSGCGDAFPFTRMRRATFHPA